MTKKLQSNPGSFKVPTHVAMFIHRYCGRPLSLRDIVEVTCFLQGLEDGFSTSVDIAQQCADAELYYDRGLREKIILEEGLVSRQKSKVPTSSAGLGMDS